jgi:hypothetical protein
MSRAGRHSIRLGFVAFAAGAAAVLAGAGCGGAVSSPPMKMSQAPADPSTLTAGTTLAEDLVIAEGTTTTIDRGAQLIAESGVTITVRGTLKIASAAGTHARISAAGAGQTWTGLVVENGGDLEADGLDLDGAATAIDVRAGAAAAHFDDGTIMNVPVPFMVERGGRLDTSHATVVDATSASSVNGELHASYLDYSRDVLATGIVMGDALAVFDATDSTFHGTGIGGNDYIVSYGAALVHIAYSTITDSHCAFHFDGLSQFQIDHVTAGASSPTGMPNQNYWGAMLYGSGVGPSTISASNFMNVEMNLDEQNPNGPLTITNTYTTGKNATDSMWTWLPAEVATAPIPDAMPR